MELLALLWSLIKLLAHVYAAVIFFGIALGILEVRQTERFRRARAGWRSGRRRP